jgi:alkylhydroperoxidase family enzyme
MSHGPFLSRHDVVTDATEEEQVELTSTIIVINGWNRIAVGFGGFVDPAALRAEAAAA